MAENTSPSDMPAAELDVDEPLVRSLLAAQHPDLADLPLTFVTYGWDNVIWRLGDGLVVRLPRREMAAALVESELRWLPQLAPRLPLPIPAPMRAGAPTAAYPWSWSVCPWLAGDIAARTPPDDPIAAATALGAFLRALHERAPADAPHNPYRGIPLAGRDPATRDALQRLAGTIDVALATRRWDEAIALPLRSDPPTWVHADLHPGNVLVHDGRISAVIDFGDLTAGDPATDLSIAWTLLPREARPVLRAAAQTDDRTWARGYGWALAFGLAITANSADNPLFAEIGRRILANVFEDDPPW